MTVTDAHANALGPGLLADPKHLVAVHVSSQQLGAASGSDRPEQQLARSLSYSAGEAPARIYVRGPSGSGKTSLMLRAAAEAVAFPRPVEVLILRCGEEPERLASPAAFVHYVLSAMRDQEGFASVSPDDLASVLASQRTETPKTVSHSGTIDAKVLSYQATLNEAVTSLTDEATPEQRRELLTDALSSAAEHARLVVLIDDTDRFAAVGPDGRIDTDSIHNLFQHGVNLVAELPVAVVVGVHPTYDEVPAVAEVASRHGFEAVSVPELPPDADVAPLRAILDRRLEAAAIDERRADELFDERALAILQSLYFEGHRHDLREVLRRCRQSARLAATAASERILLDHVQQALDAMDEA